LGVKFKCGHFVGLTSTWLAECVVGVV